LSAIAVRASLYVRVTPSLSARTCPDGNLEKSLKKGLVNEPE
jgi:hypothetical protein